MGFYDEKDIENAELGFFVNYFLPLATKVMDLSSMCHIPRIFFLPSHVVSLERAAEGNYGVEAKNKEIVADQLYALFPSFCNLPTDLEKVTALSYSICLIVLLYYYSHLKLLRAF